MIFQNDGNTGLRVFSSIEKHNLNITRAAFTGGRSPYKYLDAFNASLFLSAKTDDVKNALENGHAAATIIRGFEFSDDDGDEIRIKRAIKTLRAWGINIDEVFLSTYIKKTV